MGVRNYLIEGVSGTGKTSVATELQRRGFHAVHGDRELAYKGDPLTGRPLDATERGADPDVGFVHRHHLWDIDKVERLIADKTRPITFFCGGSRNFPQFLDLLDGVFVLSVDRQTLERRLAARPPDEFGGQPAERALVMRLHQTGEDIPRDAIAIDASAPLDRVVEDILGRCGIAS